MKRLKLQEFLMKLTEGLSEEYSSNLNTNLCSALLVSATIPSLNHKKPLTAIYTPTLITD